MKFTQKSVHTEADWWVGGKAREGELVKEFLREVDTGEGIFA